MRTFSFDTKLFYLNGLNKNKKQIKTFPYNLVSNYLTTTRKEKKRRVIKLIFFSKESKIK